MLDLYKLLYVQKVKLTTVSDVKKYHLSAMFLKHSVII